MSAVRNLAGKEVNGRPLRIDSATNAPGGEFKGGGQFTVCLSLSLLACCIMTSTMTSFLSLSGGGSAGASRALIEVGTLAVCDRQWTSS